LDWKWAYDGVKRWWSHPYFCDIYLESNDHYQCIILRDNWLEGKLMEYIIATTIEAHIHVHLFKQKPIPVIVCVCLCCGDLSYTVCVLASYGTVYACLLMVGTPPVFIILCIICFPDYHGNELICLFSKGIKLCRQMSEWIFLHTFYLPE